jgi:hypothetical protein
LPGLFVVGGYAQADLRAYFEAAIFLRDVCINEDGTVSEVSEHKSAYPTHRQKYDIRRLHGILCGKKDSAVVDTLCEWRICGSSDREVPFEHVVLQRLSKIS